MVTKSFEQCGYRGMDSRLLCMYGDKDWVSYSSQGGGVISETLGISPCLWASPYTPTFYAGNDNTDFESPLVQSKIYNDSCVMYIWSHANMSLVQFFVVELEDRTYSLNDTQVILPESSRGNLSAVGYCGQRSQSVGLGKSSIEMLVL